MKKYILFITGINLVFAACEKKNAIPSTTTTKTFNRNSLGGKIYTFAGNGTYGHSGDGGPATAAEIAEPCGLALDASGNIYIADQQNHRIRKVNINGIISTIAGNGIAGYTGDGGPATAAELTFPMGIVVDASGDIYFSDGGTMCNCIRKVNSSGIISTIAGIGGISAGGYSGDGGPANAAQLRTPAGLALDGSGNLYVTDCGNERIRKINTIGIISTVAGGGTNGLGYVGPATSAILYGCEGVAVDDFGNIYIAEYTGKCVRKVNTSGIISNFAGNGAGAPYDISGGYSGDGGPDTAAELFNPTDVKVDGSGNVYIVDADNYCIRKVNTAGIISTYAGNGNVKYSGDGESATAAGIGFSQGIGLDDKGNLYISCLYFCRVRVVYK